MSTLSRTMNKMVNPSSSRILRDRTGENRVANDPNGGVTSGRMSSLLHIAEAFSGTGRFLVSAGTPVAGTPVVGISSAASIY